MAAYDYRCRVCDVLFEVRRPIEAAEQKVRCPQGHRDVTRVFTPVAVGARSSAVGAAAGGGGCCGGACGCG